MPRSTRCRGGQSTTSASRETTTANNNRTKKENIIKSESKSRNTDWELYLPILHKKPARDRLYRLEFNPDTGLQSFFSDTHLLPHVIFHSPTGMSWGYSGSGPADLALSILADYFGKPFSITDLKKGKPLCAHHHQPFKFAFIAHLEMDKSHTITGREITKFLSETE